MRHHTIFSESGNGVKPLCRELLAISGKVRLKFCFTQLDAYGYVILGHSACGGVQNYSLNDWTELVLKPIVPIYVLLAQLI